MQTKKLLSSIVILAGVFLQSCETFLQPDQQVYYTQSRFFNDPGFAEGLLLNAYLNLPVVYAFTETATDDAVINVVGNVYRNMATGQWTSQYYPMSNWQNDYTSIYYCNYFLSIADKVSFSWQSDLRNRLFKMKLTGEAYGLRAWYNFELLRQHGGKASGTLLGFVPMMDTILVKSSDWKLSRASYDDCVQLI